MHSLHKITEKHVWTMANTVKARIHHGANSLDITIPTEFVTKYNISGGDVFEVTVDESNDDIIMIYRRVYKNN